MAAVEVTISGTLYDKYSRVGTPVTLIGEAIITGLGVGGGPMPPSLGKPPGIWGGPIDPYPDHGLPQPPGTGTWPPQRPPHPARPIVTPPPGSPDQPPTEPIQPPVEWKAVWHPTEGWIIVGIPTGDHVTPST